MIWHYGNNKPSMNIPPTWNLKMMVRRLIMELQCNASAVIKKIFSNSLTMVNSLVEQQQNQLKLKSVHTFSLTRISPRLWVYLLLSLLLLSIWFYRWSLSNVLTGSERTLTLNNLKQLPTLFSLPNSSIQVYSCFWSMPIWLSINHIGSQAC